MKSKSRFISFIIYLIFLCCLLPAAIYIYKNPAYNFDMLGYMALIVRRDKATSIEEVHKITYPSARQNIPPDEYQKLTQTPAYRKRFEDDPTELGRILPNYIVKPFYISFCWLFYKNGVPLPAATVLPSIVAYIAPGIFMFHWLNKYLHVAIAFLGTGLLMYSTIVTSIARLSASDSLSALFFILAVYFILERKQILWMFIFFPLSIFTRVDNIITCFFIISFLTFFKKWKSISFVSTHFTFFAFLALLVYAPKKITIKPLSLDQALLSTLLIIGVFRFLLLPDLSDRFYLGFYVIIVILLTRKIYSQNLAPGK